MKILVVTQYFWPEQFKINDLCDAFIERGHEVTVYTGLPNYPEGEFFKGYSFKGPYNEYRGKIKIIRSPLIPRGKSKSILLAINYFSYFFISSLLAPILVRGKFDKIFIYEPSPITVAIPAIVLKYLKKAPIFFWVTDLWPESLEATGAVKNKFVINVVKELVKWLYKHSDRILITSKGFTERVKSLGGSDEQVIYFPQWAEKLFLDSLNLNFMDPNIPENGFKLMFAGNIGSAQDFRTIIKAAIILKDEINIHFLILGDGVMRGVAENEIAKNKLEKTFHFLGRKPLEMMPNYYSKADAMLMSLTDDLLFSITVPSKLQTYLASKKPILVSMNGEGADIVNEWKSGITVPASSPEKLADAILNMSKMSKEELFKMGENAFNCYKNEFEREMLISRLEKIFSECDYK